MEVSPDFSKFWAIDQNTNVLKGFYIDLIDEIFKLIDLEYSINYNFPPKFDTYNELGNMHTLKVIKEYFE